MTFARGNLAWGECGICGFRYLLSELKEDGYRKGLLSCPDCWDMPEPQEQVPDMTDPVALEHPSPEQFGGTVTITLPVYVISANADAGRNEQVASGTFDFATDTFKCALYSAAPAASYSTTDEVTGSGYTAAGVSVTASQSGTQVTFTDADWTAASLTFTHALVYRVSDGLGVADLNLGATYRSRAQDVTIEFPDDFVQVI